MPSVAVPLPAAAAAAPEHARAQNEKAFAYVRPHDLDVERYAPGGRRGRARARARLERAIVVGPIARLELVAAGDTQAADHNAGADPIEAQIPAHPFNAMGFREGETLVVTPRQARVFLEG